jgi:CO/xanthine dehydrogenase FAD-binding subunit
LLVGEKPTAESIELAAELAATQEIDPTADINASVAYRRHLARTLARRTLTAAFERARTKGI